MNTRQNKGFTLLEILLVIAAIGILASIVIVAINPLRQIGKAENASRWGNINTIQKALDQYYIANGKYPDGISSGNYEEVCDTGGEPVGGGTDCITTGKIDLRELVPAYIAEIPRDPNGGGYKVGINPLNNQISVWADKAKLGDFIVINPMELALVIGGTNEVGQELSIDLVANGLENIDPNNIIWYRGTTPVGTGASYTVGAGDVGSEITAKVVLGGTDFASGSGGNVDTVSLSITGTNQVGQTLSAVVSGMTVNPSDIIWYTVDGAVETQVGTGANYTVGSGDAGKEIIAKLIVSGQTLASGSGGISQYPVVFSSGIVDTTFNSGSGFDNYVISTSVQSDGKIIVGGYFNTYQGGASSKIIRLNTDGTRDTTFNLGTGFNNYVRTTSIQQDGKILVGGFFTSYNGVSANRIIRLNSDGTVDTTFNMGSGFNGNVYKIVVSPLGEIFVGGYFSNYNGVTVYQIVKLNNDGTRNNSFDTSIGPGFDSSIYAIDVQSDNKVIIGGTFNNYQGITQRGLVRLNSDGSKDTLFNIGTGFTGGFGGLVTSVGTQSDGKIIVGGYFTSYNGISSSKIIRLNSDGSRDSSFNVGSGFNNDVYSLIIQSDDKIVVGGEFTNYKGISAGRILRLNTNGDKDTSFNGGLNSSVNTIFIQTNGKLVIGGYFTGVSINRIARLE